MKYMIVRGLGDLDAQAAHQKRCEEKQVPFIYARAERTRCTLYCECIDLVSPAIDKLVNHAEEIQIFFQQLDNRYPRPAKIDPGYPAYYFYNRLLVSDVEEVATETYDFLTEILTRTPDPHRPLQFG